MLRYAYLQGASATRATELSISGSPMSRDSRPVAYVFGPLQAKRFHSPALIRNRNIPDQSRSPLLFPLSSSWKLRCRTQRRRRYRIADYPYRTCCLRVCICAFPIHRCSRDVTANFPIRVAARYGSRPSRAAISPQIIAPDPGLCML